MTWMHRRPWGLIAALLLATPVNLLNGMSWANPSTTIGASDFGQVLRQADAYYARPLQYTVRVEF